MDQSAGARQNRALKEHTSKQRDQVRKATSSAAGSVEPPHDVGIRSSEIGVCLDFQEISVVEEGKGNASQSPNLP